MAFPQPLSGQVIRYSYLWHREYLQGQEEGTKDRPCAVILVTETDGEDQIVTVLPITHAAPTNNKAFSIEIPAATKQRLGLDDAQSWVILSEANRFIWPGPDIRPAPHGGEDSIIYGLLPTRFFEKVKAEFLNVLKSDHASLVKRTE